MPVEKSKLHHRSGSFLEFSQDLANRFPRWLSIDSQGPELPDFAAEFFDRVRQMLHYKLGEYLLDCETVDCHETNHHDTQK